jgi:hypothetical protein
MLSMLGILTLSASEKDKVPARTWSEWFHGRPHPGTIADYQWLQDHRIYMEWRTGTPLTLPNDTPRKENNGLGSDIGSKVGLETVTAIG